MKAVSMPCSCTAWTFGPVSDVTLCWQHFREHEDVSIDSFRGKRCHCLSCRAKRRGLPPIDYVVELHDQAQSSRGKFRPGETEMPMDVGTCGCLWHLAPGQPFHEIANPCPLHAGDAAARARMELRRHGLPDAVIDAMAVETARHLEDAARPWKRARPEKKAPWWKRLFSRKEVR